MRARVESEREQEKKEDEREERTGRSETGDSMEWMNEDDSNRGAEEHERVDRRWSKRERMEEEKEGEREEPSRSGGLGWPRRRATSRRRSSHQDYHPSLHFLPPVAR